MKEKEQNIPLALAPADTTRVLLIKRMMPQEMVSGVLRGGNAGFLR